MLLYLQLYTKQKNYCNITSRTQIKQLLSYRQVLLHRKKRSSLRRRKFANQQSRLMSQYQQQTRRLNPRYCNFKSRSQDRQLSCTSNKFHYKCIRLSASRRCTRLRTQQEAYRLSCRKLPSNIQQDRSVSSHRPTLRQQTQRQDHRTQFKAHQKLRGQQVQRTRQCSHTLQHSRSNLQCNQGQQERQKASNR